MPKGDAEIIREYLVEQVELARSRGDLEIEFRFGEISNVLGLQYEARHIDLRQVLDTRIFQQEARVFAPVHVSGPREGQGSVYSCVLI